MAESLESFKSYIGKSETAIDVVTASAILKFAATLGQENPPMEKGDPIPPGWYGGFFPASHRPSQMRTDGQASGGGIVPPIPLPRRRIGGTRVSFQEPLRIGDEITRVTEIAEVRIDDGSNGAMVTVIERNSISNSRGLAVVEERDMVMLSEARAEAAPSTAPTVPAQATWLETIEPNGPEVHELGYGQVPAGMKSNIGPTPIAIGQLYRVTFITIDGGGYREFAISDDGTVINVGS